MNKYEKKMKELFDELIEVYLEYNPTGKYLSLSYIDGYYKRISNDYWEDYNEKAVKLYWNESGVEIEI